MCEQHPTDISRRGFTGLAALGLGLSLSPMRAAAQTIALVPNAFCLMCIDYRYVRTGVDFFDGRAGLKNYDEVSLAGASLAASSPSAFPDVTPALWEQLAAARYLHSGISKVFILDHMGCGAYKVQFGEMTPEQERIRHEEVARRVGPLFAEKGVPADIYLLTDPAQAPDWIWPLEKR